MGKEIVAKQINLPELSTRLPDIVWGGSRFQFEVVETPSAIDTFEFQADFDPSVAKADRSDCLVAVSSGMLTGILNIFLQKKFNLENAHNWGREKVGSFVTEAAKLDAKRTGKGSRITSLEQAIRYLEKEYPMSSDKLTADFGGGLQHHLRDFTHHPTALGLVFSILSQFTQKGYGTNTAGKFAVFEMSAGVAGAEAQLIGETFGEKILLGTFNWAMHLVSDMAGSSSNPGEGTGIPGPLLSTLKELSSLPLFKNINLKHGDDKIAFSQWVSKLFNGTMFKTSDGKPLRFDLRTELGLFAQATSQLKAVAINEAIVRAFYMITRLKDEIERKNVRSISDLKLLDPQAFMPHKSRALTRMLTIASSTFVGTNMTTAAVQAAVETGGSPAAVGDFFLRINYVGVVRMGVAIYQDSDYLKGDIGEFWVNHFKHRDPESEEIKVLYVDEVPVTEPSVIELSQDSRRIVTALQVAAIEHDCWSASSLDEVALKQQWKQEWLQAMQDVKQIEARPALAEKIAYQQLQNLSDSEEDRLQALLIAQELNAFNPYAPLNSENDKEYKKLKIGSDYIQDVFLASQTKISKDTIEELKHSYSSSRRALLGTTKKIVGGVALTGLGAIVTGGAGLLFAPELAVLLFGGSFAGLSGAALTSASLAAAGGGALAAGGLGMAGGTAVIAGGAGALGLAGSGALSLLALYGDDSVEITREYCARVLALSKAAMTEPYQLCFVPRTARIQIMQKLDLISELIEQAEADEENEHKKALKSLKAIRKDLKTCLSKLDRFVC
ncbi:hypothetical protein [Boudabousia marimammalium]|uniref:Uncharacterized protein n=1 Tax=Boudabousia marimammalium TaxID=156892 RepID=A0A1Q5PSC2_9ACTO|nr:hypothetical protein [Boudabousia marimammalium]OKL50310.1 hypothetical protein BM477_02680 [Boudabousia marimammalium]